MERPLVTAVTHSIDEARITLTGVPDRPGIAGSIFAALAEADVNVDIIIQNEPVGPDRPADLSFTVDKSDLSQARATVEPLLPELDVGGVETDEGVGKVSIVGAGMRSHPGVAAKVFATLGRNDINIEMISTSPIKISCIIREEQVADATRALHEAFSLGPEAVQREDPNEVYRPARAG